MSRQISKLHYLERACAVEDEDKENQPRKVSLFGEAAPQQDADNDKVSVPRVSWAVWGARKAQGTGQC